MSTNRSKVLSLRTGISDLLSHLLGTPDYTLIGGSMATSPVVTLPDAPAALSLILSYTDFVLFGSCSANGPGASQTWSVPLCNSV